MIILRDPPVCLMVLQVTERRCTEAFIAVRNRLEHTTQTMRIKYIISESNWSNPPSGKAAQFSCKVVCRSSPSFNLSASISFTFKSWILPPLFFSSNNFLPPESLKKMEGSFADQEEDLS